MSYVVLARKWRPQSFDDLVGQEHIATTLANAIALGRVAHAFLFTGVRGVGKTTSARILAKALNCEKGPTSKPCLVCPQCVEITEGRDLDVQEIDGATYTGVEDIRQLQERLPYRPGRDRYRVYIVDEVHMLSKNAWNAFLKTLEEPPPHVKFIFATTEVEKVPITILSRCQRYDFKLISAQRIAGRLAHVLKEEKIEAEPAALDVLAREAAGSMRDAMSLLDQVIAWAAPDDPSGGKLTVASVSHVLGVAGRSELHKLAAAIIENQAGDAVTTLGALARQGFDVVKIARDLLDHLRDLVVVRAAPHERSLVDIPDAELEELKALAGRAELDDLTRVHQGLAKQFDEIAKSVSPRGALEMTLIRLAARPPLLPVDELVRRIVELEQRLRGGGGGKPAPPGPGGKPPPPAPPPGRRGGGEESTPPSSSSARPNTDEPPPVSPSAFVAPPASAFVAPPGFEALARPEWDSGSGDAELRHGAHSEEGGDTDPRKKTNFDRDGDADLRREPGGQGIAGEASRPRSTSAAPPAPIEAPPMAPDDEAQVATFTPIVEIVRTASAWTASLLERAHVVGVFEDRVVLAFPANGFERLQLEERGARATVEDAVRKHLSPRASLVLEDMKGDAPPVTLARLFEQRRRAKRLELERLVRTHPFVVAAERELGAELRELRIPEDAEPAAFAAGAK